LAQLAYFDMRARHPCTPIVVHQRRKGIPVFYQPLFFESLIEDWQFRAPVHRTPNFVLERRVNRQSRAVVDVLRDRSIVAPSNGFALGDDGTLHVDEAPRRRLFSIAPGCESWRATARLRSRRRHVAKLEVEIDVRATGSALIQIRPLDRNPQRWGARHQRRYFTLAHAAADRLAQVLNEHASVDVVNEEGLRALWSAEVFTPSARRSRGAGRGARNCWGCGQPRAATSLKPPQSVRNPWFARNGRYSSSTQRGRVDGRSTMC
jgi:hypothetical protein